MYAREVDGHVLDFGVSGLLWNDNVLMYDRQSESLWSQVQRRAVAGPRTGARLRVLPSTITTWEKWRRRHPDTRVLTTDTGHQRDYSKDPYEDYYRSKQGLFSVFRGGPGEEAKELVAGVEVGGEAVAVPLDRLRATGPATLRVGGETLTLWLDSDTDTLSARGENGRTVMPEVTYWMVWKSMYPDTRRGVSPP